MAFSTLVNCDRQRANRRTGPPLAPLKKGGKVARLRMEDGGSRGGKGERGVLRRHFRSLATDHCQLSTVHCQLPANTPSVHPATASLWACSGTLLRHVHCCRPGKANIRFGLPSRRIPFTISKMLPNPEELKKLLTDEPDPARAARVLAPVGFADVAAAGERLRRTGGSGESVAVL